MTRWAFDLSEAIRNVVMVRSVTRMSHAAGICRTGISSGGGCPGPFFLLGADIRSGDGPDGQYARHSKAPPAAGETREGDCAFEQNPFNGYEGPERPELLIITSSACTLYSREAVSMRNAGNRVGILKLGTTWPLPPSLSKGI
jgi:indolepyruvate ferredoxin oxidoreductase alpha subunit